MSAEGAPYLPHERHLHVVPPLEQDSGPDTAAEANERIAAFNESLHTQVPENLESAKSIMAELQTEALEVRRTDRRDAYDIAIYEYKGYELAEGLAEEFLDSAGKGIFYWRMTPESRQEASAVLLAGSLKQLPTELRGEALSLRRNAQESSEMTLRRFKGVARARLKLDEEITAATTKNTKPAKKRPGETKTVQTHRSDKNAAKKTSPITPRTSVTHTAEGGEEYTFDLADVNEHVAIDVHGKAHVSGSHNPEGRSRNGQFISDEQLALIHKHAGQIEASAAERQEENELKRRQDELAADWEEFNRKYRSPDQGDDQPGVGGNDGGGGGDDGDGPQGPVDGGSGDDTPRTPDSHPDIMRDMPEDLMLDLAYALNEYTDLAAARERSTITAGRVSKGAVEAARQRYETVRRRVKQWEYEQFEQHEVAPADRVMISQLQDKTEAKMVGLGMKFEAERLANPTGFLAGARKRFYNWWARQGEGASAFSKKGLKGMAKKAAVMAAIGLPVGVAAGAAGAFVAGPIIGGALAAGAARGVARGFLRGRIDRDANAISVAGKNFESRVDAQYSDIEASYAHNDGYIPHEVTGRYAEGVNGNVRRNRRRTLASAALGAVFGGVGAEIGHLAGATSDHGHSAKAPGSGNSTGPSKPGGGGTGGANTPPPPAEPHIKPVTLRLDERGEGIWAATDEYAQQHGIQLSEGEKQHIVGEILKSNGQTWESARDLPMNYKFTINEHELEELMKYKKAA